MTEKNKKESGRKWDGVSRPSNDLYKKNYNEIFGQKEQEELKESYQQSLRNKEERDKKRYNGSVNFQEEGDFIFCSRCKDSTIHKPSFGKCMKCGLEEYNEVE